MIGGGTPSKANQKFYNGDIPWATVRDMRSDIISETECMITKDAVKNSSTNIIPKNNVIIATRVGLGKICFIERDTAINQDLRGVIPKKNDLAVYYLYWWFKSIVDKIIAQGTGATVQGVTLPFIKSLEIPLPSLTEQQRIVKILDEVFAAAAKAKANAEKNLANAAELFQSYLQSVFANPGKGWEEKTLGEVVETTQGVQIEKSFQSKVAKKGYRRYLYISDFDHDENLKYVEDIYPKKIVTTNDLIVVNTGASAGKIFRGIDGILSNNLFKVSFKGSTLDRDFLHYFVNSNLFKSYQKTIVRGTANPHMGHENFNSTAINLPSITEQKVIVSKLDALSAETKKLEANYRQKLSALEELKKSVLRKAFSGEM